MQEDTVDLTDNDYLVSELRYFWPSTSTSPSPSPSPSLPFIVPSDAGPEGSIHHVSIRAGVSDEGEVTDPALLAPEGGTAVVDPGGWGGVDPCRHVEEHEVLGSSSSVSWAVPVYGGVPA